MFGFACSDEQFCPNDLNFPELYIKSLNFHWPFPDEAIFTSGKGGNGLPRLSNLFKEHAKNIGNWRMAEDFFQIYGNLRPLFASGVYM